MKAYDVIVIGAGPAGYSAAIRCAELGLRTACIDRWLDAHGKPALGGSCVHAGCIPSKVLLQASGHFASLSGAASHPGLLLSGVELDLAAMQRHKQAVIDQVSADIQQQFETLSIDWIAGEAGLLGDKQVQVQAANGDTLQTLQASNIIIAPGSIPIPVAAAPVDQQRIVDSTGAMCFSQPPKRLAIIGAGVIGLEMASIWSRLGAKVILLEAQENFLPSLDHELSALALQAFSKQGLEIRFGARVVATHSGEHGVRVKYRDQQGEHELKAERLIVAAGRRPPGCKLCAAETGLQTDEAGFIRVDPHCQTTISGVYAIGDVVRGPMLAHKGIEEAHAVAETITGQPRQVNYDRIPWVIYTDPELAWIGATEQQLQAMGTDYRVGRADLQHNQRALLAGKPTGLIKLLSDARSDQLLGIHLMGSSASELINEAVLALEFSASAEDLARTCHSHPSLGESLRTAASRLHKPEKQPER